MSPILCKRTSLVINELYFFGPSHVRFSEPKTTVSLFYIRPYTTKKAEKVVSCRNMTGGGGINNKKAVRNV